MPDIFDRFQQEADEFMRKESPLVWLLLGEALIRILEMRTAFCKAHDERPTRIVLPRGRILGMQIELGDKLEVK